MKEFECIKSMIATSGSMQKSKIPFIITVALPKFGSEILVLFSVETALRKGFLEELRTMSYANDGFNKIQQAEVLVNS